MFFPERFVFQLKANTVAEFHAAWAPVVRFDRAVVFNSEIKGDFDFLDRSVLKSRIGWEFVLRIGYRAERDNHVIRGKLWIFPNYSPSRSVDRRNRRKQATKSRENDGCTIVCPDYMRSRILLSVGQRIRRVIARFQT